MEAASLIALRESVGVGRSELALELGQTPQALFITERRDLARVRPETVGRYRAALACCLKRRAADRKRVGKVLVDLGASLLIEGSQ